MIKGLHLTHRKNVQFLSHNINRSLVFGLLTTKKTAAAALKFANGQRGERPVVAVVYSHSQADHFGGASRVANVQDKEKSRLRPIKISIRLSHEKRRGENRMGILFPTVFNLK